MEHFEPVYRGSVNYKGIKGSVEIGDSPLMEGYVQVRLIIEPPMPGSDRIAHTCMLKPPPSFAERLASFPDPGIETDRKENP